MAQRAEEGGVRGFGGRGARVGLGGEGPCVGAAPPLRATHSPRPHPPRRPPPPPPLPSLPRRQDGYTALDHAKREGHTQVITLLENAAAVAAQVGPSTYVQSHGGPLAIVSIASVRNSHGYAHDGEALLWSTHLLRQS